MPHPEKTTMAFTHLLLSILVIGSAGVRQTPIASAPSGVTQVPLVADKANEHHDHASPSASTTTSEDHKDAASGVLNPSVLPEEYIPLSPDAAAAVLDGDRQPASVFPHRGYTPMKANETFFLVFFGIAMTALLLFTAQGVANGVAVVLQSNEGATGYVKY
ncbi:unnamed protein product [Amoebophrya sp. A25]|nr:unnamed protein product [Amoebophrya sp. A25]|eukprot:GSA25T00008027001.1